MLNQNASFKRVIFDIYDKGFLDFVTFKLAKAEIFRIIYKSFKCCTIFRWVFTFARELAIVYCNPKLLRQGHLLTYSNLCFAIKRIQTLKRHCSI